MGIVDAAGLSVESVLVGRGETASVMQALHLDCMSLLVRGLQFTTIRSQTCLGMARTAWSIAQVSTRASYPKSD